LAALRAVLCAQAQREREREKKNARVLVMTKMHKSFLDRKRYARATI
jgi:hypothetical protein